MSSEGGIENLTRFKPKKRKVLPGNGGRNCCVCRRNDRVNRDLTFHSFPIKGKTFVSVKDDVSGVLQKKDRLTLWCEFANVSEAHTKYLCLCSLHFKRQDYLPGGDDKQNHYLKKIAVPSIFNVGQGCQAQPNVNVEMQPTTHTAEQQHEVEDNLMEFEGQEAQYIIEHYPSSPCQACNHQKPITADVGVQTEVSSEQACISTKTEMIATKAKNTQVSSSDFFTKFMYVLDTDGKLNSLTGISNLKLLSALVRLYEMLKPGDSKSEMTTAEKIVLTFMKLKLNLPFSVLAILFNVVPPSVKNIFHESIFIIDQCISSIVYWPTKEEFVCNMPKVFIENGYSNVCVILAGIEIKTIKTKSKCFRCRCKLCSYYKGNRTLKIMVGVSPGGLIVFVSRAYGGRASNKHIFLDSGILRLLEPHVDSVMVDKGFSIHNINCSQNNIKVIMHPFLKKKKRFSKEEAKKTRAVTACQVHVKKIIGRMKDFRILKDPLPWFMSRYAEVITRVIAATVNLSPALISDSEFPPKEEQVSLFRNNSLNEQSEYEDIEIIDVSFQ